MLTRTLRQTTARHPDKVAFTYKEQSWTYAEIGLLTDQFARNLLAAGIVPGDRVALSWPVSRRGSSRYRSIHD